MIPRIIIACALATLFAGASPAQSLLPELGSPEIQLLSAEEWKAVCAAVPRACLDGKQNTKYSYWDAVNDGDGRVLKELSAKEWRAACAAVGKLPTCQIAEKEREKWLKTKPGKVCSQSFVWTRRLCDALAAEKIEAGMTRAMVRASWGAPKTVHRTSEGQEEWVYGGMWGGSRYSSPEGRFVYLFFVGGILRSTSESSYR